MSGSKDAPVGHVCVFYHSGSDLIARAAQFLGDGLSGALTCLLMADPGIADTIIATLERRHGKAAAGRVSRLPYQKGVDAQLEQVQRSLPAAGEDHRTRVAAVISVGPLWEQANFEGLLEYEHRYDRLTGTRSDVATLCLYDARLLSGVEVSRILRAHPAAFRVPASLVSN